MRNSFARAILTLSLILTFVMPVLAQDESIGRTVTQEDWLSFMPVVIGSIIVVLVVDAFFIMPIFRKSNGKHEEDKS